MQKHSVEDVGTMILRNTILEEKIVAVDEKGKLEVAVRILGNEIVALKMEVDDFKMKWLVYGVITIVALAWALGTYGPPLLNLIGSD